MLKKAGIVVAAAAATLLAVSPLAFAGDKGGYDHGHGKGHHGSSKQINKADTDRSRSSAGLINVDALNGDNEVNVPIQACDNNVNVLGIQVADLTGALGLLGGAAATDEDSCKQENSSGGNLTQIND